MQPALHRLDQRATALLAHELALFRWLAAYLGFDRV